MLSGMGILMLGPLLHYSGWITTSEIASRGTQLFSYLPVFEGRMPLVFVLLLFVLLISISTYVDYVQSLRSFALRQSFLLDLQETLNRVVAEARWSYFLQRKRDHIHHMITVGIPQISNLTLITFQLLSDLILCVVYFMLSCLLSVPLTILAGISVLILFLLSQKFNISRIGLINFERSRALQSSLSSFLDGVKLAKSYNLIEDYILQFNGVARDSYDVQFDVMKFNSLRRRFYQIFSAIIIAVLFWISISILSVSLIKMMMLLIVFSRILPRFLSLQQNLFNIANYVPIFDQYTEMVEAFESERECLNVDVKLFFSREIELRSISFFRGSRKILDQFSCTFKINTTIAILGSSGVGKSTLLDIIMGLIHPDSGGVFVDGVELNETLYYSWRNQVSYVPQETAFFYDTLRANLVWAYPHAKDKDIWEALRLAAADQFVSQFPLGLDTMMGDRGVCVSGGERQRLALARALLRKPAVLILDEATNALDAQNEALIFETLKALHGQLTIILVAHRESTIELADLVVRLDTFI